MTELWSFWLTEVSAWLTTLVTWAGLHAECMEQDWVPKQVAIAAGVAGDSHVSITWITDDPRDDNDSCNTVAVAQISGPLGLAKVPTLQVVGTCLRYSLNSAPDLFGNYTSGRIHRVLVQGLVAGSLYQYKLQLGQRLVLSYIFALQPTWGRITISGNTHFLMVVHPADGSENTHV